MSVKFLSALVSLFLSFPVSVAGDSKPVIGADQAPKHVGEEVIVEMTVRSSGSSRDGKLVFLNSKKGYKDPKNFIVVIPEKVQRQLRGKGIDNAEDYYLFQEIRVEGRIKTFEGIHEIYVDDADQLTSLTTDIEEKQEFREEVQETGAMEEEGRKNPLLAYLMIATGSMLVLGVLLWPLLLKKHQRLST